MDSQTVHRHGSTCFCSTSNTFLPLALPHFYYHTTWWMPGKKDSVIHCLAAGTASEGLMAPVSAEKSASGAHAWLLAQKLRLGDCLTDEMRCVWSIVLCEVWDPAVGVDLPSAYTWGVTESLYTRPVGQYFCLYLCIALNEPWAAVFFLLLIQGRQAEGGHSRLDI